MKKQFFTLFNQLVNPFNLRVIRDYSVNARTNQRIFFMHLGKCAGTSVFNAIRHSMHVGWEGYVDTHTAIQNAKAIHNTDDLNVLLPRFHELRIHSALQRMSKKNQLVGGHIPYCKTAFQQYQKDYNFLTVMRDPVERVISIYKYSKARGHSFKPKGKYLSPEEELQFFLNSPRGKIEVNNYVAFFGGLHTTQTYYNNVEKAKQNVEDFHLIGFTDNLTEFANQFHKMFGLELDIPSLRVTKQVFKEKSSPKSGEEIDKLFTQEIRQQIAELCKDDYKVYHYAKELFC